MRPVVFVHSTSAQVQSCPFSTEPSVTPHGAALAQFTATTSNKKVLHDAMLDNPNVAMYKTDG
jgi:hypothetical protein